MDRFFEKHEKAFLWLSLLLGVLSSVLMFDCKVSLSGDDCDYIINAQGFIRHFTYPGGRGALYPMVISPFLIGGLRLVLLKALSAVFILLSMWVIYKGLKGKLPAAALMPGLLILNICPYIFFYACHTYSEPFFMLVQALFVYLFSKYFLNDNKQFRFAETWRKYLLIGLCFLAMGLTRTIGYGVMGAVILFFAFQKQWKNLVCSLGAGLLVYVLFDLIKTTVWPDAGAPYGLASLMAKNHYNPEQGMEDLAGYLNRLIVNSHVYLSGFTVKFMGLRSSTDLGLEHLPVLTVALYIVYAVCLTVSFKYNKSLFFVGLYAGVMSFASFILLQTMWEQDRLIMIYYPLMLIFLLGSLYYLLKNKWRKFKWIYPVALATLLISTGAHLKVKAGRNARALQENMLGNDLYGLTPDWENFVKMCRWADKNLDKDAIIASRKPSISYIYTGRQFSGLFNVPHESLQQVMEQADREKDRYVHLSINYKGGIPSQLTPFIQYIFLNNNANILINGEQAKNVILFRIDRALYNGDLEHLLQSNGIGYTTDVDALLKQYASIEGTKYAIISPDRLLETITAGRLKYFLLPKLRVYTFSNTGEYINTVHQYLNILSTKYPKAFRVIHSIGTEETCELAEFMGVDNSQTQAK